MLYARVSTADQTLSHQRAHAEAAGFHLDEVVADYGSAYGGYSDLPLNAPDIHLIGASE